jgi:Calcium-dependent channel, 7TM region, putative phosphate
MTSTFQKFNDEEMLQKLREKDMKIVMTPIPNPIDIFWSNMGGSRGFFFFRRLIINTAAILILLFLTTPASLLRSFQQIKILNFLNLANYVDEDSPIGFILHEAVPPLLIISLNQLFLLLIDYSAFMEKHYSFSHCQISIFQRSVLYLGFNMFIIPAITLATADPLYEIIFQKTETIANALKDFYFTNAGNFFIIFLLQNAAISGAYHLMRMGEIMNSFGSSWIAFYKRHYLQDNERWRKKESDIFQYGYFYAQMLTAYTITLSYS